MASQPKTPPIASQFGEDEPGDSRGARWQAAALDAALLPLVIAALVVRKLVRAIFDALIWLIDLAFPVILQLLRIPLAAARLLGDGVAALLRVAIACFPLGGDRRERWRSLVRKRWSWIRKRLSYRAFEEAIHSAFERGMAWVFRRCRHLSPRAAILVIFGALLWIPISFGAATALHAVLIAKATVLPPWAQLLHPLATIAAKSKLLVLPVYPAAWPQAKKHGLVRGTFSAFAYLASLRACRRFLELDAKASGALDRALSSLRPAAPFTSLEPGLAREGVGHEGRETKPVSARFREFYDRWSIKFTPEYYESREREHEAAHAVRGEPKFPSREGSASLNP